KGGGASPPFLSPSGDAPSVERRISPPAQGLCEETQETKKKRTTDDRRKRMKQKIELLAPAGNLESLLAAVHSGADAVYFGYGELNARRNAKNFDEQSLAEASRICKERGVKMHMTVNTMVYDREYEAVLRTLEIACKYGIDALIVQDLGVAALVRRAAP